MSQACTASCGSASRIVASSRSSSSSPRCGEPLRDALANRRGPRGAGVGPPGGHALEERDQRRLRVGDDTERRERGADAPRVRVDLDQRPRGRKAYWRVVSAPSSVPTQRTTSASSSSVASAPSSHPEPAASG